MPENRTDGRTGRLARLLHEDAALAAIVLLAVAFSVFEVVSILLLDSPDLQHERLIGGAAPLRNLFELLSFIAQVGIAAVGFWAISFAKRQAESAREQAEEAQKSRAEAEHARLASIYMTIAQKWNAPDLVVARIRILSTMDEARRRWQTMPAVTRGPIEEFERRYLSERLLAMKANGRRARVHSYLVLLQYFEDLGAMCRYEHVSINNILDLLGNPITTYIGLFETYVENARRPGNGGSTSTYANAIYLYRCAATLAPEKYAEPAWPLPRVGG